jgi:hypothetical protein
MLTCASFFVIMSLLKPPKNHQIATQLFRKNELITIQSKTINSTVSRIKYQRTPHHKMEAKICLHPMLSIMGVTAALTPGV